MSALYHGKKETFLRLI